MRDEARTPQAREGETGDYPSGPSSLIPHPSSLPHVGVLGGGQLGRMLALAGYPLGLRFRFLDLSPRAPAGHLAELHAGDYEDPDVLDRFAAGLDVVTYEFENVPVD